jgi:hypothetical protein
MPANYVLLEKITVGAAGASSVTFSSIPQTGYTDLVVKASMRSDRASQPAADTIIYFNGDTGANYTTRRLEGNGSTGYSQTDASSFLGGQIPGSTATSSTFANCEFYVPNYTSSTFKSASLDDVMENNATTAYMDLHAGIWNNTAAITSITYRVSPGNGNFVQGSTFYLYGVAKLGTTPAIAPKATGGSIIETDGTYWYHAFLSSGTFTPTVGLSCDVLVVAGGGGGATGGGGGAGGVLNYSAQAFSSAKTITIGAGGAGFPTPANGSVSSITGLTSPVGGGRAAFSSNTAATGGSGGAGSGTSTVQAGAAGTSGQGNAGGNGARDNAVYGDVGGGGGGAGGVGGNAIPEGGANAGGAGGAGTNAYSSWLSVVGLGVSGFIAGGGGGYTNGAPGSGGGGGGAGSSYTGNGQAGTANTGGGGGAFGGGANNGGGSGLVIVRYLV